MNGLSYLLGDKLGSQYYWTTQLSDRRKRFKMPMLLGNRNINIACLPVEKYDHFPDAVHLLYIDTGQCLSSIMGS